MTADVGHDLRIESLQDTSSYHSKDHSVGVNATIGAGAALSGSYSSNHVEGDYASVGESSGLRAGDGGFKVDVGGNTDLKAGLIASSVGAEQAHNNVLKTGTLTSSTLTNTSSYTAKGITLSGGYSFAGKDESGKGAEHPGASSGSGNGVQWQKFKTGPQGAGIGISSTSGGNSTTSRSGISAGTVEITDASGQQARIGQSVSATELY